jgi:membrane protein DedA with SNARE-associated domain
MLEHLIDAYGYLAVLVGTFLEGETILIMGGIAAKLGYLELPWVIVYGFTGSLIGDQLAFLLGRWRGRSLLERHPAWDNSRAAHINDILERHRIPVILSFRFLHGLRNLTPFVLGMSRVPFVQFALLNVIGAALWAGVIGSLGYSLGHAADWLLGDIRRYELEVLAAVSVMGFLGWVVHALLRKRSRRTDATHRG